MGDYGVEVRLFDFYVVFMEYEGVVFEVLGDFFDVFVFYYCFELLY